MKALYRKYRPVKLSDVVGQEQVCAPLENSLKQNKVGHAYLFVGPRGCGKTSVARIFAHEVNGFKYEIEDEYIDIIEIDGASNRGIENIRELREKVMIAPTVGKYKIYIIDEVHMLTREAFNALLKTLEEPPKHAIFIMATTDVYKVPVTITSRAQTYTFKLADRDVMFKYLRQIADQEKIKITDDALSIIVKRGGGSFRDSLSLLDQISSLSSQEITKDMVVEAMGLPQDETIANLLAEYVQGNVVNITTIMKDLLASGVKPETLAEELIETIIDKPETVLLPLLSSLTSVKAPFADAKLLVALTERIENSKKLDTATPAINTTTTQSNTTTVQTIFNWDDFLNRVHDASEAIYSQLIKTTHRFNNGLLEIFPKRNIVKNILSRENNLKVLNQIAGQSVRIKIHAADKLPDDVKKDAMLEQISDIMGGEVQNDGGGNPF